MRTPKTLSVFLFVGKQAVDEVRLEDDWVPLDERLGAAELDEVIRAKEAHSSAVVLESVSNFYRILRWVIDVLNFLIISDNLPSFFCLFNRLGISLMLK